jgi:hypothetical protein
VGGNRQTTRKKVRGALVVAHLRLD